MQKRYAAAEASENVVKRHKGDQIKNEECFHVIFRNQVTIINEFVRFKKRQEERGDEVDEEYSVSGDVRNYEKRIVGYIGLKGEEERDGDDKVEGGQRKQRDMNLVETRFRVNRKKFWFLFLLVFDHFLFFDHLQTEHPSF